MTAIYPGSFNPFHRGHYDILKKAEAIFGKVIICIGRNPEKAISYDYPLPKELDDREVIAFSGLLTDLIKTIDDDVVIIRGLRDTTDMVYELNQYRYLKDMSSDIKVVSIFSDIENAHISSSGIKYLDSINHQHNYLKLR